MSQNIKIYIPSFIGSVNYDPVRTLPRLYFYNGKVECQPYYLEGYDLYANTQTYFPYFDHYNVVTGSFPTTGSQSLLFNNEAPVYGDQPTGSLYSNYWSTYVQLLYNPYTRLIDASAIIPLANYADLYLNDVIEWRGNYYYLRAINNYSVKTGECNLQLLGPIIRDTFGVVNNNTPTTTTTSTTSTTTTSTTTTSTTTTTTTSTTTTTIDPTYCADKHYLNNSSVTVYWSAQDCLGHSIGGYFAANGGSGYTGCIDIRTFGASGPLTLLGTAYC